VYKYLRDWRKSALRAWLILYAPVRSQCDHLYGIETSVKCYCDLTAYFLQPGPLTSRSSSPAHCGSILCFKGRMRTQPNLLAEARCLRSEPAAMAAVAVGRLVSPIASFSPAHYGSTLGQ
jgi:hypothetical protein